MEEIFASSKTNQDSIIDILKNGIKLEGYKNNVRICKMEITVPDIYSN